MGYRFRKSINLGGGFRINLSKSGIGYSWGTKGFRVTKTAKGTVRRTLSIPGTGISHVTETRVQKRAPRAKVRETSISCGDVSSMSTGDVGEILAAMQKSLKWYAATKTGLIVTLVAGLLFPPLWVLSVAFLAARIYVRKAGVVSLEYDTRGDQSKYIDACAAVVSHIANSEKIWRIARRSKPNVEEHPAESDSTIVRSICTASKDLPFPLQTNIGAVAFTAGNESIIILPDKVIVFQRGKVAVLAADDVDASIDVVPFIEPVIAPADAKIVGKTWEHVTKSGKPDGRFKRNHERLTCLYGKINLKSASGLDASIMFSRPINTEGG